MACIKTCLGYSQWNNFGSYMCEVMGLDYISVHMVPKVDGLYFVHIAQLIFVGVLQRQSLNLW